MVLLGGGRGHAIDYSVIFARVTSVRDEFVDRPKLDVLGHRLREHASPPKVILGILPEGALPLLSRNSAVGFTRNVIARTNRA